MNSRERFLTAMTGGKADRVPCVPDISNMIPCRLTGKPFWDIYLHQDPPLWRAYLAAADHFGLDAWFFDGALTFEYEDAGITSESRTLSENAERIVRRTVTHTPAGDMETETTFYVADPPTDTVKPIQDIQGELPKLRHLFREPIGYATDFALAQKEALGGRHAFGTCCVVPGFHLWLCFAEGGVAPLAYAEMDCPEVLAEIRELNERACLKQLEMILDSRLFDFVLTGGSGGITMAGPDLFDKYAFPTLQKVTRMCRQTGVASMVHSCGRQMHMIRRCAEETDLDCINPLEIPPMGDCDLAEVKRLYGDKLALMGNLHTTDVMLRGSAEDVERAAKQCIDDAAAGGGFILSTGDQCGRDTPDENIRKLVEVCETYGRYD